MNHVGITVCRENEIGGHSGGRTHTYRMSLRGHPIKIYLSMSCVY